MQEPRYFALLAERPSARRQLVCGLHVHVGMQSFERCLETLEAVLPWLPAVLALSVNSPYLEGAEPGVLSGRAGRLLELPRAGAPPVLDSVATWERVVADASGDYTKIWWDVRPHPRFGTLEVRIADQQTSAPRAAAFAALVQALCVAAPAPAEPLSRDVYLELRAAAARGVAPTDEMLELVEPAARQLGSWELVAELARSARGAAPAGSRGAGRAEGRRGGRPRPLRGLGSQACSAQCFTRSGSLPHGSAAATAPRSSW